MVAHDCPRMVQAQEENVEHQRQMEGPIDASDAIDDDVREQHHGHVAAVEATDGKVRVGQDLVEWREEATVFGHRQRMWLAVVLVAKLVVLERIRLDFQLVLDHVLVAHRQNRRTGRRANLVAASGRSVGIAGREGAESAV